MTATVFRCTKASDLFLLVEHHDNAPNPTTTHPAEIIFAGLGKVILSDASGAVRPTVAEAMVAGSTTLRALLERCEPLEASPAAAAALECLRSVCVDPAVSVALDVVVSLADDAGHWTLQTSADDHRVVTLPCDGVHAVDALAAGLRDGVVPQPPVYYTHDAAGVANCIQRRNINKVIVMTGAGTSVAAGIPDFRTPKTGLYDNLDKYDLPSPEALFTLDYLEEHPETFYRVCNEMQLWPGQFAPTHVHHLIALLNDKGMLQRCYTQNIDGLERMANLPAEKLVEAHGTFATARCVNPECRKPFPTEDVKACVDRMEVPRCPTCADIVKPDVVFFGEALPHRFFDLMHDDLPEADMLIVLGTSLVVYPFAALHMQVGKTVPRVLVNRDMAGEFAFHDGYSAKSRASVRDVFLQGDCQTIAQDLATALGFGDELQRRYAEGKDAVRTS